MNADRLLALFEQISEAPDAILRMRRFILDLAVRGKLVEQDPEDEPAEELLKRLKPAKVLAYEVEGLRSRQPVSRVNRDDLWFEISPSWALPCFDDVFVIISGVTKGQRIPPSEAVDVPYLRVANVQRGSLDLSQVKTIGVRAADVERYRLKDQDILMTEGGDWDKLGRAAIWANQIQDCIHQNHVFRLRVPSDDLIPDWVVLYSNSDPGRKFFENCSKQTTNLASINMTQLRSCPLPLPPLAEQHRIVAKVDELMALCDQLEAARQQREQCRERLVGASLERFNQPSEDPDAFRSDARFALKVLPSITTTMAQIKQLRQTVLNLAVRGKLVKQDPEDEPAEELLRCIAADRSLMQKTRGRFRNDEIKPISNEAVPYEPPQGWVWARFGNIMYSRDGERVPVSKDERSRRAKIYDYYGASGVIDKIDDFLFDKPLLLIGEDGANLLNRSTPIAFIARGKYWVNNHAHVMDGISEEFLRFIELTINATDLAPYVTGTAQPKMNQAKMNSIPVALPPLAEQHRIVAKVDELMALCDQLEQQLSQADQVRRGLLLAVLQEALTEPDRALIAAARAIAA